MQSARSEVKSIRRHRVPAWWSDAKLGIFVHWTPASVPAYAPVDIEIGELLARRDPEAMASSPYAEWYENSLRFPSSPVAKHHAETYGDRDYVRPSAEALGPLAAPYGVFGILGNHDDDHDMPAALGRNGVEVLKDARTRLAIRHEPVDLVGIRYWTKRQGDIAALTRGGAPMTILLAHDPRRLTEAAALDVPLVLSGHTHGGQVVLPLLGAIAAQKFPVVAGIGRRERTTLFVSRGVGTIYVPVRINCPPEVALLTLQPA